MLTSSGLKIALAVGLVAYAALVIEPDCWHDPTQARAMLMVASAMPAAARGALPANSSASDVLPSDASLSDAPPSQLLRPDTSEPEVFYYDERIGDLLPLPPAFAGQYGEVPSPEQQRQAGTGGAPTEVTWKQLLKIGFVPHYDKDLEMEVYAARYSKRMRKLAGQLVEVEGYVIPYEPGAATFALSANPFASCFFCGKASPASVMTVEATGDADYDTDDFRRFRGRLQLNADDAEEFYYVLEEAVEVD